MKRPFLSGHCGPSNPANIHRQCRGAYEGHVCSCACHQTTAGESPGISSTPVSPSSPAVLTILPELEQRSEEWYAQRRGMVTASAVGQLIASRTLTAIDFECPDCGAGAYAPCVSKRDQKPIQTLHPARAQAARDNDAPPILEPARNDYSRGLTSLLVAERITGYTDPTFLSNDMIRGIEEEPRAVETYSAHYDVHVSSVGFMVRDFGGFKLGYSPDALVGEEGLLEIKAPRAKTHIQTVLADEVPERHMAQCQAGLLVSGRQWLDFASFHGGEPMWIKRVFPDQRWFDAIVNAVRAFEQTAAEMVATYAERTKGLPATERIDYNDLGLVL